MARLLTLFVSMAFLAVVTVAPALADKRVALVVGNAAYKNAGELTNPKNDATDMSAALKKAGFQVVDGFDLDKTNFDRKIRDFAAALSGADVGLFFYAGHGLQVAGQNFLVPVDAELTTAAALEFEMVRLDVVHRIMEHATTTNILFLDACRNNPLARNLARALGTRSAEIGRGLAAVESGSGTLISFSTQPGNVALDGTGRNSPFAGALVKHISTSRDDLSALLIAVRNDVMNATQRKQVPWEHSALTGRFYFNSARQATVATAPPTPAWRLSEAAEAWDRTKDTANIAALELFIGRYKDTYYADLARLRIAELKKRQAAAATPPPAPNPTPAIDKRDASAPVTACDELAAADYDQASRSKGVYIEDMRGPEALAACQEAVKLYPKEPRFLFLLGRATQRSGAFREANELQAKALAAGYVAANLPLGRAYEKGDAVTRDLARAKEYYQRAANAGNTSAMAVLARYYRDGVGVARDLTKDIEYLRKATELGSPVAMNDLGWHYRDGLGVVRNEKEALTWFVKAAERGNLWAMRNIGDLYEKGRGVQKDCKKAREWYTKAAVSDHTDAKKMLAALPVNCPDKP
jgi:uncharacterized caspase-like protein